MYKISHISTSSSEGGSAISAKRIHEQLVVEGFNSELFVGNNEEEKKVNYLTRFPFLRNIDRIIDFFLSKLGFQYFFVPSNLSFNKKLSESSIIQIYNIHGGFFQFSNLKKLNKIAPLIWRLSDYWSMTGHCAYPGECEKWKIMCKNCPALDSYPEIGIDNTENIWREKKNILEKLDLKIVVPSKQLYDDVKKSPILGEKEVFIIPNGIDTKKFKSMDNDYAKEKLKIPNKFTILFIAQVAFENYRKGTHILQKIFEQFKDNNKIQFLVAGLNSEKWKLFSYKNLIPLKYNKNISWKNLVYNSADLLIVPSVNENFPNVILESMACGTPVMSFKTGGIDNIIDKKNGILVENFDIKKFIDSIQILLKKKKLLISLKKNCRKTIEKNFSIQNEVKSYIEIYNKVLNENNN